VLIHDACCCAAAVHAMAALFAEMAPIVSAAYGAAGEYENTCALWLVLDPMQHIMEHLHTTYLTTY
jgi:hypothetical protein